MGFLLFLLVSYILLSISLYFLFPKAEVAAVKGLIPGVNFVEWCKLIGRKPLHALLLLVPIVNIFIYAGMAVDMVRSFKKYTLADSALAIIAAPFYFFYLAFSPKESYDGPTREKEQAYAEKLEAAREKGRKREIQKLEDNNPYHKSVFREWVEAIVFAVFAAAFIRMFLIEAYVIPTPSMEGSLLTGDFLFVSKATYGIRLPETVAMVPLLHNRIPRLNRESYLERPKLEYRRLPGIKKVEKHDPVVFNYPEGDSVYVMPGRTWSVYDVRRGAVPEPYLSRIESGKERLVTRPRDKMDHYIKRCIAVAGDSLEIRDRTVYINGEETTPPEHVQFLHTIVNPSGRINTQNFDRFGISPDDIAQQEGNTMLVYLGSKAAEEMRQLDPSLQIVPFEFGEVYDQPGTVFPHNAELFGDWDRDNYGPIYIPKAGVTTRLTPENLAMYERLIRVYEDNELEIRDGKVFINGKETDEYTFQQDYYWMMGDNRHNSEDSRIWGFVPETHIVGRPLIIWFSTKNGSIGNGVRWNRIFKNAAKS
jgi:signal peptidase I